LYPPIAWRLVLQQSELNFVRFKLGQRRSSMDELPPIFSADIKSWNVGHCSELFQSSNSWRFNLDNLCEGEIQNLLQQKFAVKKNKDLEWIFDFFSGWASCIRLWMV